MVIWKALGFEPTFLSTSKLRNLSHICEREQEKSLGLLPPPWVHRGSVTVSLRSGALKESSTYREAPQAGTSGFAWWLIYRILLLNTDVKMVCQYTYIHVSHSCSAKYFPFQIWRTEVRTVCHLCQVFLWFWSLQPKTTMWRAAEAEYWADVLRALESQT